MSDFIPNYNIERILLKSLVYEPEIISDVVDVLSTNGRHFSDDYNRNTYEALIALYYDDKEISEFNLINELSKKLPKAAAITQYVKIVAAANTSTPIDVAYQVLDQSVKRQLDKLSNSVQKQVRTPSLSYTDIVADIDNQMIQLQQDIVTTNMRSLKSLANEFSHKLEKQINPLDVNTISTGYKDINSKLKGGFVPGQFTIIAARPSMGKTSLMTDMAINIANQKIPVAIFSMEMTQNELMLRMLNQYAKRDVIGYREKLLQNNEIREYLAKLAQLPISIDDSSRLDIVSLKTKLRRLQKNENVKVAFIDYLQLMQAKQFTNREREVADLSRSLKLLAKDMNMPIICLAQLNRAVETRKDRKPVLSDLRESGAIEQDADLVLFIHREKYYNDSSDDIAEVVIAKNRLAGITGSVKLHFDDSCASFVENFDYL